MSEQVAEQTESPEEPAGAAKLVPVSESIKYRRRAQQAENRLQELEQQLTGLQKQFTDQQEQLGAAEAQRDEARDQLSTAENRSAVERMLAEAGTLDIEAASLLLAKRVDLTQDLDADSLQRNVEQLLLDKPFLRSKQTPLPPKTASAKPAQTGSVAQLAHAADRAINTGDRRDVAEYLRLRRQTATV